MAYMQVANSRGGKVLVVQQFRYLRNKSVPQRNRIYWRCGTRGCSVSLHTNYFDVVKEPGEHGHAGESDLVATTGLVERMLNVVAADPTLPVRRVYNRILAELGPEQLQLLPAFSSIKSRLERRRAKLMPPIPQTVEEVVVEGEWAATWTGEQFLRKSSRRHGFLLFATDEHIRVLSQCDQVSSSPITHNRSCQVT